MKRMTCAAATILAVALLLGASCGGDEPAPRLRVAISSTPAASFDVEVAATPSLRARGLMNRSSVPSGTGMLFVFPRPTNARFWMKDTLVDLDIAFIADGRVVEVRTMTPCRAKPCPMTGPPGLYEWALETPAGELSAVKAGDAVKVEGDLPDAS